MELSTLKQDGSVGYYQTVNKTTPVAGDVKYVDRNGDGVVDDNDRDIIGNPNPDFTYGFRLKYLGNPCRCLHPLMGYRVGIF